MASGRLKCFFLKVVSIFLLLWPQFSILMLENKRNWKSMECISRGNHSYCRNTFKLTICRESDLLDFKDWDFTPSSALFQVFPIDPETRIYVRQVRDVVFSTVRPVPFKYKAYLVAVSSGVLTEILDLKTSASESEAFIEFIAGNKILPNSVLLSHRYGGHHVCDPTKIGVHGLQP